MTLEREMTKNINSFLRSQLKLLNNNMDAKPIKVTSLINNFVKIEVECTRMC